MTVQLTNKCKDATQLCYNGNKKLKAKLAKILVNDDILVMEAIQEVFLLNRKHVQVEPTHISFS